MINIFQTYFFYDEASHCKLDGLILTIIVFIVPNVLY